MDTKRFLKRHRIIIDALEMPKKIEKINESIKRELGKGISLRTFQRDIKEIQSLYDINIKYDDSMEKYIKEIPDIDKADKILNRIVMIEILELSNKYSDFIQHESTKEQSTDKFYEILQSIEKKYVLKFEYKKSKNDKPKDRVVEPYILKEFKNRWYLVGKDINDRNRTVKAFALDLLSNPKKSDVKFIYPDKAEIDEKFKNYFGIDTYPGGKPQKIVLSIKNTTEYFNHAEFISTMPLHHTQEIVSETEKETIIELYLYPSDDFKRELLYFGNKVKVIKPAKLAKDIAKMHRLAFENY